MKVEQVYALVNASTKGMLGTDTIVAQDLSNVVDIGNAIIGSGNVDNYVKSLVDHIGKVIFVNRPYVGAVPSVLKDGWEFGSILEKIQADLPEARENKSWDLVDGQDYNPNIFYKPKVSAKFFNSKTTFEVDLSFTQLQVKESFSSAEQLNAFLSMLYNSVEKAMAVKFDSLIMSTINNATAQTLNAEIPDGDYGDKTGTKAVNLLKLFNDAHGTTLTAKKALADKDFLRFSTGVIRKYVDRMSRMSTLFNVGGKARFTPRDRLHIVMLSDYVINVDTYLLADTFNKVFNELPNGVETVPYWQGVQIEDGVAYGLESIGAINVSINDGTATAKDIEFDGAILGVMFDNDALGVTNMDKRVVSHFNPKAEFYTNFYKFDAGFFNDLDENFVVFYVADAS